MSYVMNEFAPPTFTSKDSALAWAEVMVEECEVARLACNVLIPDGTEALAVTQQRRARVYMIKFGAALGALSALLRTEHISPVAYNALVERANRTLKETVVGAT